MNQVIGLCIRCEVPVEPPHSMAEGMFTNGQKVRGPICSECCRLLTSDPVLFWKPLVKKPPPLPPRRDSTYYQTTAESDPHRSDHVWFFKCIDGQNMYKCCLCGCLTLNPPPFPTPKEWVPAEFELPLSPYERNLCKLPGSK